MLDKTQDLDDLAVSSIYETEPEGYEDQDWFANAVAKIETALPPRELLRLLKEIEKTIGRRESVRWGPREIDLDLLLYDQLCLEDSDITIPHPRMHQRDFVLRPLADIAADAVHPVFGKSVAELLATLSEEEGGPVNGPRRCEFASLAKSA